MKLSQLVIIQVIWCSGNGVYE